MSVWLALYKHKDYTNLKSGAFSTLIRLGTKGSYSHSEIVVGDNPFVQPADCYSSSVRDGGVRKKTMSLKAAHWDLVPIPWADEAMILEWFKEHDGEPYDWNGVWAYVLPFTHREKEGQWFCSESSAAMLGLSEAWRYSPTHLRLVVEQLNQMYEIGK